MGLNLWVGLTGLRRETERDWAHKTIMKTLGMLTESITITFAYVRESDRKGA